MLSDHDLFINNQGPYSYTYSDDTPEIDVSHLGGYPIPDPNWLFIDEKGHFHAFDMETDTLPTLKEVDYGIKQCTICAESVQPHYLPGSDSIRVVHGPKCVTITIPKYDRDIGHDDRVSFYNARMFGIARVVGFHFTGSFDGKSICVTLACEFVARRTNDL